MAEASRGGGSRRTLTATGRPAQEVRNDPRRCHHSTGTSPIVDAHDARTADQPQAPAYGHVLEHQQIYDQGTQIRAVDT